MTIENVLGYGFNKFKLFDMMNKYFNDLMNKLGSVSHNM